MESASKVSSSSGKNKEKKLREKTVFNPFAATTASPSLIPMNNLQSTSSTNGNSASSGSGSSARGSGGSSSTDASPMFPSYDSRDVAAKTKTTQYLPSSVALDYDAAGDGDEASSANKAGGGGYSRSGTSTGSLTGGGVPAPSSGSRSTASTYGFRDPHSQRQTAANEFEDFDDDPDVGSRGLSSRSGGDSDDIKGVDLRDDGSVGYQVKRYAGLIGDCIGTSADIVYNVLVLVGARAAALYRSCRNRQGPMYSTVVHNEYGPIATSSSSSSSSSLSLSSSSSYQSSLGTGYSTSV